MQTTASESGSATTAPSPHYRHVEPIGGEPEAGARAAVAAAAALAAEGRRNGVGDSNRRSSGDLLFPCIMPATLLLKAKGVLPTLASPSPPTRPPSPLLFLLKKILSYTILVPNCFCILFPSCISSSVSSGTPVPRGDGRSTAAAEDFAGDDPPATCTLARPTPSLPFHSLPCVSGTGHLNPSWI